jgi:hypothetical protein
MPCGGSRVSSFTPSLPGYSRARAWRPARWCGWRLEDPGEVIREGSRWHRNYESAGLARVPGGAAKSHVPRNDQGTAAVAGALAFQGRPFRLCGRLEDVDLAAPRLSELPAPCELDLLMGDSRKAWQWNELLARCHYDLLRPEDSWHIVSPSDHLYYRPEAQAAPSSHRPGHATKRLRCPIGLCDGCLARTRS